MKKSVLKFIISLYIFWGFALSAQDCGVWPTLSSPEIYMDRPYVNGVYYTFSGNYINLGLNINTACDLCRSIYFTTATARIGNEELEASNNYALIPADKIIEEGEYEVSMSVIAHSPCDNTEHEYSGSTLLKVDNTPPIVEISTPSDGVVFSTSQAIVSASIYDLGSKLANISLSVNSVDYDFCKLRKSEENPVSPTISFTFCADLNDECFGGERIGIVSDYGLLYDLTSYMEVAASTSHCRFEMNISALDIVGNNRSETRQFYLDLEGPKIDISSYPSGSFMPVHGLRGRISDISEIKNFKISLIQEDSGYNQTAFNGYEWVSDTNTLLDPEIEFSTRISNGLIITDWKYSALTSTNIISGSHYILTVKAEDSFGYESEKSVEFDYDACQPVEIPAHSETGEKFEVGDAVFRELNAGWFKWALGWKGHAGVYVVSDSDYQKGASTQAFVSSITANGSLVEVNSSDMRHYIIMAGGGNLPVESVSFEDFKNNDLKYWGTRKSTSTIDPETRDSIGFYAIKQLGKPYSGSLRFSSDDKDSDGVPTKLRCDAVVVYAYEKGNKRLIKDDDKSFLYMSPRKLAKKIMRPGEVDNPVANYLKIDFDPEENLFKINLEAQDQNSGIDKVEYYYKKNENGQIIEKGLYQDDDDTIHVKASSFSMTCNPGKNIRAKVFDRAGNWSYYGYDNNQLSLLYYSSGTSFAADIPDNNPPIIISTGSIVADNSKIKINYVTVQDDGSISQDIIKFYRIDVDFRDWEKDEREINYISTQSNSGNFILNSGTHTIYLAAVDEYMEFGTATKEFVVPNLSKAIIGPGAAAAIDRTAIKFDNLTSLNSISINPTDPYALPPGYSHLPSPVAENIVIDGTYEGGFEVMINYSGSGISAGDESNLRILHEDKDITAAIDRSNKIIKGYSTGASPFAVVLSTLTTPDASLPDLWPPDTLLGFDGKYYRDGEGNYHISTRTIVKMLPVDDRAGNINTYYRLDLDENKYLAGFTPDNLDRFIIYSSPFTISEGIRRAGYGSIDASGNYELIRTATFYADGTSPKAVLSVSDSELENGDSVYISVGDSIALSGYDLSSNGVSSGLKTIGMLIDINPQDCAEDPTYVGAQGTCDNPQYYSPFSLSEGTHTVYYRAIDNVNNEGDIGINYFVVTSTPDITPPSASLWVNGNELSYGSTGYISQSSSISLVGTDPEIEGFASGISLIRYLIDIDPESCDEDEDLTQPAGSCANPVYVAPFSLSGGTHTVYYGAVDNSGNESEISLNYFSVSASTAITIDTISPSSGPIGMPFTIEGENFGSYISGKTNVLFNNTTSYLSLWTDTKIQGTVPSVDYANGVTISSGIYSVEVERNVSGESEASNSVEFLISDPVVYSLSPSSGPIGMPFTITGGSFGNYASGKTNVLFNDTTAYLSLWTDTKIQGTVPGSLSEGSYSIKVERIISGGTQSASGFSFYVNTPTVYNISPSSGPIGVPFTITGQNFGNYASGKTNVLFNNTTAYLSLWTDTRIQGTVPGTLPAGQYPVKVERVFDGYSSASSTISYLVTGISLDTISPSSGPIGMPFTITGSSFGNYISGKTNVLFNNTTSYLSLWTDTKIQGTVPSVDYANGVTISSGIYSVEVERNVNGESEASNSVEFLISDPVVYSLSPSSGPIGMPFTIEGASFGNYVSGKTSVLFNNTTSYLSLWTDTKIQGTAPAIDYTNGVTLSSGAYSVTVKRSYPAGGVSGEVSVQAGEWTMNVPYIETAPSTAAYGGQITVTGGSFGNYVSGKTSVLLDDATCYLSLWTDGKIQGKLPGASAGEHALKVRREISGGVSESLVSSITVVYPTITSISPESGNVGSVFTINGAAFGVYESGKTKVLFGDTTAYLTLWNDAQIKGLTPNLISGSYEVKARRESWDGGGAESVETQYLVTGGFSAQSVKVKSGEFAAGDIFVAPNPAKTPDNPTFHIETGIADSVEIRIYSASGELVKKHIIIGSPSISSPEYAYQWEWSGAKASGVYFYTIESRKGSSKIKKQGKFAVIK